MKIVFPVKSRIKNNGKITKNIKDASVFRVLKKSFYNNFNDNALEEELLEYIELNRNKVQYVWIG